MKMAESRGMVVDAESQSCHPIVTSPACGRGRGLSRGRGDDVNEGGAVSPKLDTPLPGLRARPLPKGEVTPAKDWGAL
jgi:hypothetical protein